MDFQGDSGGALSIDLDSETLDIAGGDGISTAGSSNTLTVSLDTAVKLNTINDTNGNEQIQFTTTSSADNYIRITNSADSDAVTIGADGDATNLDLRLSAKGNGVLKTYTVGSNREIVTDTQTQTLTNKSINLANNTLAGTLAQFNTACSDSTLVSIAGTETLSNKSLTAPTLTAARASGTGANGYQFATAATNNECTIAIPNLTSVTDTVIFATQAQALTNKTIDSDNNTISNIVNADIKASAAIAHNKLAAMTAGHMLIGNSGQTPTATAMSGDATLSSSGALSLAAAQTNITSILATDLKIGEDDQTKIDFATPDQIEFYANNVKRLNLTAAGLLPEADNAYDLGSSTKRFANLHTGDLHLNNTGSSNDVDGTSGNWTIQEGEDNLYVINNLTGRKFKMMLSPVEDGE